MSIRDTLSKIKSFAASDAGSDAAVALIVVLVGTGSFGLGRLSSQPLAPREPVQIVEPGGVPTTDGVGVGETGASTGAVVASKTGSKYHFPWCSGASQIAAANKVQFASAEAARAAGYLPASNCKGLE